jgi:uncharacterized protein YerC
MKKTVKVIFNFNSGRDAVHIVRAIEVDTNNLASFVNKLDIWRFLNTSFTQDEIQQLKQQLNTLHGTTRMAVEKVIEDSKEGKVKHDALSERDYKYAGLKKIDQDTYRIEWGT